MTKIHKDEEDIRALDAAWGEAANTHSAEAVAKFYSPRATLVWPFQQAVQGPANILQAWKDIIAQYEGLNLKFVPTRIDFSKDRDMATDFGVVEFGHIVDKKPAMDTAKYLVVWVREGGSWKVLYDSWNTNTA